LLALQATIERYSYSPTATMGRLFLNGLVLQTIEPPWLQNKVNLSCIPEGYYLCRRIVSPRYGDCFEIIVPGRTGILFHVANWARELKGCIAIGLSAHSNEYRVISSKLAISEFNDALKGVEEFKLFITQYKPIFNYGGHSGKLNIANKSG